MCRAKASKTHKEQMKRLRAWVKKGKAWAQDFLAHRYLRGTLGLPQSYLMAAKLYGMAAKQGDPSAMADLGVMYYFGQGVDQSYEKAVELYKMAANQGHARAQFNLGLAHQTGKGVDQSNALAREWWAKTAAQGGEAGQRAIETLTKLDALEGKSTPTTKSTTTRHCNTSRDSTGEL